VRRILFLTQTLLLPLAAVSLTAQESPTHEVGVHFRLPAATDTPGAGGVNATGSMFAAAGGRRLRWFSDVSFVSGTHATAAADPYRSIPVKQDPSEGQPAILVPVIGGIVGGAAGLVVGAFYGAARGGESGGGPMLR
jgi:hypothetical protein